MDTERVKYKVLEELERERGEYVSGAALATGAGVSRNAVWKAVKELIAAGYPVESSRKGYSLPVAADVLSEQGIKKYLLPDLSKRCRFGIFEEVGSTNVVARKLATEGADEWSVVVAESQNAGRGRQGKSFYSESGDGIYFSFVLRPTAEAVPFLTVLAAVATARAIERVFSSQPRIKWVNDVYVDGRKCVGILTEAVADLESGGVEYAVVGIGVNVREPVGGYPEAIRDIAGPAGKEAVDARNRIVAETLNEYYALYSNFDKGALVAEYRERSFLIGRRVTVLKDGAGREATVFDVDDDCRLVVDYGGEREALRSGEVSLKLGNKR